MKTIVNPNIDRAIAFIKRYHQNKPDRTFLQIVGECIVDYDGRARSFLDWGQRIVFIKQDGNVLVPPPFLLAPLHFPPSPSPTSFYTDFSHCILPSLPPPPS